jgi:uncharacterized protein YaeQ
MVRVLAFALFADEQLEFGRGLSSEDEPDLAERDLTGALVRWIDVGLPDEREVRKACGRARAVDVLAYGGRAVELWWEGARGKLEGQARLAVRELMPEASQALAAMAERSMRLQVTIQDGHISVTDHHASFGTELRVVKERG